eukprot:CAMPEP_0176240300 /NCGR_PEP_ID=MMETSP0121_2-20121125/29305_1 /TAXON_ID=160619 /ORGANISM="Kryptoperidinium foliaceum, Strain CCMP 1326" /LENGTH=254 /DNA_ID=CAMNT_0017579793 /DNA_START=85 /DNA_END=847 /DNA_ORIENTATION=-
MRARAAAEGSTRLLGGHGEAPADAGCEVDDALAVEGLRSHERRLLELLRGLGPLREATALPAAPGVEPAVRRQCEGHAIAGEDPAQILEAGLVPARQGHGLGLQILAIAPLVDRAGGGQSDDMVLPAREVHDAVPLQRQAADHPGVAGGRAWADDALEAAPELPIVVLAPDPELSGRRHGPGEVVPGVDLDDRRHVRGVEDGVVARVEVLDLLELKLVLGLAAAEAAELPPARGVEPPRVGEHDGVLRAASDLL